MNVLICDDEPAFCTRCLEFVKDWFEGHEIPARYTVYSDPAKVLEDPGVGNFQIALLDVEMDSISGIELGQQLKKKNREVVIIYISAYLEFALDGYRAEAFRYLLKRDFEASVSVCLEEAMEHLEEKKCLFTVKKGSNTRTFHYDDIYYFQSDLRKIMIYGSMRKQCLESFYGKLPDLARELEAMGFLRIGRSELVNMKHITKIVNYTVFLENGVELSTTRTNYAEIQQKYLVWRGRF